MPEYVDLVLIHPPAFPDTGVPDHVVLTDLETSLINASPQYEIPPVGFFSLKSHLAKHGFQVRILNLALRKLRDPFVDLSALLKNIKPALFGVSLHWLVHLRGALDTARLLKSLHPEIPVAFGGISASIFAADLIRRNDIDFVVTGNITHASLALLLKRLLEVDEEKFAEIPNLVFRNQGRSGPSFPARSVENTGHVNWGLWGSAGKQIDSAVLNPQSGCEKNCMFCGGSRSAVRSYGFQLRDRIDQPKEKIKEELRYMVKAFTGDSARMKPKLTLFNHWHEDPALRDVILEELRRANPFSTVYVYCYDLTDPEIIRECINSAPVSLILSPHSHDRTIRRMLGCADYGNDEMERWMETVVNMGVKSVDVCFMIGLPYQTEPSVRDTCAYCTQLLEHFQKADSVAPVVSPMIPFLDIGSPLFRHAEEFGYRIFHRSLDDYHVALSQPSVSFRLNYETRWMSRKKIVDVSFQAAVSLSEAKRRLRMIPASFHERTCERLNRTHELVRDVDEICGTGDRPPTALSAELRARIRENNLAILSQRSCAQCPVDAAFFGRTHWYDIEY